MLGLQHQDSEEQSGSSSPDEASAQTEAKYDKVFYMPPAAAARHERHPGRANSADYWQECQLAGVPVHDQA